MSALIVLSGCKQSSDVVSNGWIQKRKYRSGFHIDLGKQKQNENNAFSQKSHISPASLNNVVGQNRNSVARSIQIKSQTRKVESKVTALKRPSLHVFNDGGSRAINEEDSEEEEPEPKQSADSGKRAKISLITAAIALALSAFSYIYSSGFILFINPFFYILGPVALGIGLIALTIGVIYLIDHYKSRQDKTIFTERFYKAMGDAALILGITSLSLAVLAGLGLFLILLAGISAAGSLGVFVSIFLGLYLFGIFVSFFALITWPTITAIWFSMKHSKKGKVGFILWLIPFLGILFLGVLVLLF